MPSPRKRAVAAVADKKKLKVKVAGIPPRQSNRIKASSEIKTEPIDEDSPQKKKVVSKKTIIKSKGKTVQAAASVKEKAKKIASNKRKKAAFVDPKVPVKMSVLDIAAARKRKLNGEDDEEPVKRKRIKKKPPKKKIIKVKKKVTLAERYDVSPTPLESGHANNTDVSQDEEVVEEMYDDQPMVAIKQEEERLKEVAERYEEEVGEEEEEDEHHNLLINEEHQYIEQIQHLETINEDGEIEVPQEQVQAELQQENEEDEEDEPEDDEDIDENLFFGIPEQRSPELATCTHCKGKFRKEDVHEHMLTCPERYVQCRECGKILSNLQTLERHHKRFHLKIREVPCTLCDKMFIDEAAARKHLKTVHFKVKNFHCPHCDKSFSQRNKLTYHVRTHSGEKPYSCAECGRSFSLLWNLKTHLRTHTGEKPYACDTCGRRFTQKQNMTSHLTTHRKPKSDKSFRSHFPGDLDDYDTNQGGIIAAEFSAKPTKNYRAFEQAKQLGAQSIGSGHYVLGDMQSIEVHTASEQEAENLNLEHGLGLLSSVARKGDDVQVDGIVNIPENQLSSAGGNLDQVVDVLIRSNGEVDNEGNPLTTVQLGNGNQTKIIIDPNTQSITDENGQEIAMDSNTAAGLANILQNPDVLAAINSAASTNKFIVIGPVSMFDGSTDQQASMESLSTADSNIVADVNTTFSQEQLAQISAMVQQEQNVVPQVSAQIVNDSISATSSLAAVESYLHGEQPSSSLGKNNVVSSILGSIQPDGKRGPSAVLQSAQASMSRASNLTISMPPMSQSTLTISPASLSINADSTQRVKPLTLHTNVSASSSEVSSSVDHVNLNQPQEMQIHQHQMEAESTTQSIEFHITQDGEVIGQAFSNSASAGAADSSDMVVGDANEASSSGEPILMLSTDENGRPQIIVKMPDGSETIMSDPALAESLIQVPTITNAEMEGVSVNNEAESSQSIHHMAGTIQIQMPDQGIPIELPTQSGMQQHFVSQSVDTTEVNIETQSDMQQQFVSQSVDTSEVSENQNSMQQQYVSQSIDTSESNISETQSDMQQQFVSQSVDTSEVSMSGNQNNMQQQYVSQSVDASEANIETRNDMQQQYVSQSVDTSEANMSETQQLPDQSLDSQSSDNVDSSENVELMNYTQQNLITDSNDQSNVQTPDSSSQSYQRVVTESHIDSRQGIFVVEHVSASDQPEQSDYSSEQQPEQSDYSAEQSVSASDLPEQSDYSSEQSVSASDQPEQSDYAAEQSNVNFTDQAEFVVDSSSGNKNDDVSGNSYLQLDDVSQSTNIENVPTSVTQIVETENVSSSEQPDN